MADEGTVRGRPSACVVGAGLMGTGIAARLALAGIDVEFVEADPGRRSNAAFRLRFGRHLIAHAASVGIVSIEAALAAAERVSVVDRPGQALSGVDLVLEAVYDDVAVKHSLYRSLPDELLRPDTVVASTTAALSVAELAAAAPDPRRFLGWHWAFPPVVVTYAEIIPAPATAPEIVAWTVRVARRLGKAATIVREGSRPGFALNRVWYAMMDEARAAVAEGVASEDVIDRQYETSQRWPKGPFRIDREDADVVGCDPWPALTAATLEATISAEEFRPPSAGANG